MLSIYRARNALLRIKHLKSASEKTLSLWRFSKRKGTSTELQNETRSLWNKTPQGRQFSSSVIFAAGSLETHTYDPYDIEEPKETYKEKFVRRWNTTDVTDWAREELGLSEDAIAILKKQDFVGHTLFLVQNLDYLIDFFKIPSACAAVLWKAIQNLPKQVHEPYTRSYLPEPHVKNLVKEWQSRRGYSETKYSPHLGHKMPIEERKEEVALLWKTFYEHYEAWKRGEENCKHHKICFAYGPPGSGKTKFGGELIRLLKDHGYEIVRHQETIKGETAFLDLLKNSVVIHLSFANENQLLTTEVSSLQTALVIRGIKNLFGLSKTPRELMTLYGDKIKGWTFNTLLEIALKYCAPYTTEPRMVYLHLDELNNLHDVNPTLFEEAVKILATPLFNTRQEMLYTLLITTTSYTEAHLKKGFVSNPIVTIPMKPLSTEGIKNVVESLYLGRHLKWLDGNWKEDTRFMLSLLSTGGLPGALESLLEAIQNQISHIRTLRNLEDVCDRHDAEMIEKYDKAWNISPDSSARVFADAILGTPIDLNEPLPEGDNASLLKIGSIVVKETTDHWWRIHLPSPWLKYYAQLYNDFMPVQLYRELVSIEATTWSDWEKLTSTMLMLRTNAMKLKGVRSFTLKELFPQPTIAGEKIMNWQLCPVKKFQNKKKFDLQSIATDEKTEKANPFETGNCWINGKGQCVDAWTVLKDADSKTQHYTVIFMKTAFGAKDSPLYTRTIVDTYLALENLWNNLQTKEGLDLSAYRFALVVVSNCRLENNRARQRDDQFDLETKKQVELENMSEMALEVLTERALSNCIVYDASTVESFFSTFSSQALYAFTSYEIVRLHKENAQY